MVIKMHWGSLKVVHLKETTLSLLLAFTVGGTHSKQHRLKIDGKLEKGDTGRVHDDKKAVNGYGRDVRNKERL